MMDEADTPEGSAGTMPSTLRLGLASSMSSLDLPFLWNMVLNSLYLPRTGGNLLIRRGFGSSSSMASSGMIWFGKSPSKGVTGNGGAEGYGGGKSAPFLSP